METRTVLFEKKQYTLYHSLRYRQIQTFLNIIRLHQEGRLYNIDNKRYIMSLKSISELKNIAPYDGLRDFMFYYTRINR